MGAPRGRFGPPLGFPERPQIDDKCLRRHSWAPKLPTGTTLKSCIKPNQQKQKWTQERVKSRQGRTATPFWCIWEQVRKSMRNRFATGGVKNHILGPWGLGSPHGGALGGHVPRPLALDYFIRLRGNASIYPQNALALLHEHSHTHTHTHTHMLAHI